MLWKGIPAMIFTDSINRVLQTKADKVLAARSMRAALGSFVGAVVDWYDFLLYLTTAALVFNTQFFPSADPKMGTLAAFATSGVGFLFRPLGGIVFGHFGDRLGRKMMLVTTVMLMGISTALIGVLPTYQQVGWLAPLLLVVLRAIQGFAVGGEWGGAALMAVESAPKGRKAFYSSGVQVGFGVGLVLANVMVLLSIKYLGNKAFLEWGWRIPFLLSAVLVLIAVWIRKSMEESPEFVSEVKAKDSKKAKLPIVDALRNNPAGFLFIILLRIPENFTMYIVTGFTLAYAVHNLGMPQEHFVMNNLIVGAVSCATIPLFALLADRFGFKRIYMIGAIIGLLMAVPYFLALESRSMVMIIICSILLVNIAHDMIVSVQQPLFTEFFGAQYRYSGAGFGYQVGAAIWGGFTPFFAALILKIGGAWYWVAAYLSIGCLISLVASMFLKGNDLDISSASSTGGKELPNVR